MTVKPYVPRKPRRDPSNRRLNEHSIYIRHCQESNSQPDPSQTGADTTRPQWQWVNSRLTARCQWLAEKIWDHHITPVCTTCVLHQSLQYIATQFTQGRTGSPNRPGKFSLTGPLYRAEITNLSQYIGSSTVVMDICTHGLHWKWQSLTSCQRHPSQPIFSNIDMPSTWII